MLFQILSTKERIYSVLFTLWLAAVLTVGFLPMTHSVFQWLLLWLGGWGLQWHAVLTRSSFPFIALLFAISLPARRCHPRAPAPIAPLLLMSVFPIAIAFLFGMMRASETMWTAPKLALYWYFVCIPVGEELLFRKWFYDVIERLWPEKMFTATNPLPVSVTLSAIAFAIWHWQNLGFFSTPFVFFQVVYTVFTGLWLGYLRWKTGNVLLPLLGHSAINLVSSLV